MIDFVFLGFIGMILALGLKRPYFWVLLYVYIDILAPQNIGYGIIQSVPVSLIAFGAAFVGWVMFDRKEGARFSVRQGLILALLIWCFFTLQFADYPVEARTKWDWVWKAMVFAIFLPFTITTRQRIEALALTVVLTVGMIVISTGMKTVFGGGGYGSLKFFVKDNSGIYESSTLATVAIGLIPVILWFTRFGTIIKPHWTVTVFAIALCFACLTIPIGTEARTGLVCIAALGVFLLRYTEKRLMFIVAAPVLGLMALPFLPQSYYDRMATIAQPGGDESASTRLQVWMWTIDYASDNPLGGGFDSYRSNSFTYTMPVRTSNEDGNTTTTQYREVTDEGRAFHSSFFELLGEQGYPGLILWLLLHSLGVWQMEKTYRGWKGKTKESEAWISPLAAALQIASLIYLVGATFQGIGYQPVMLMIVGLQIGLYSYVQRLDSAKRALVTERVSRPSRGSAPNKRNSRRSPGAVTA